MTVTFDGVKMASICDGMRMENDGEAVTFTMGRKMSSQSSIVSGLSSLYDRYTIHINILKWTGVVVLLALTSTSIAVTSSTARTSLKNQSDCKIVTIAANDRESSANDTLCSYVKHYDLTEQYKVTVCLYSQKVSIAIREFVNGKAVANGILMKKVDWKYLQHLVPYVNSAVERAEIVKRQRKNQ